MVSIARAKIESCNQLADLSIRTFIESHGHSASMNDFNTYVDAKFDFDVVRKEIADSKNIYHIIYYDQQPAGYSKIIFNEGHNAISMNSLTKLECLYLLKEFYDLKLGHQLLEFNSSLS